MFINHSNNIIDSIVFINKITNNVLATNRLIWYADQALWVWNPLASIGYTRIDLPDTMERNALLLIQEGDSSFFLFIPNDTIEDYSLIYFLDTDYISTLLSNNMIEGLSALALWETESNTIFGVNTELILEESNLDTLPCTTGFSPSTNHADTLYVYANIYPGFALISSFTYAVLNAQVSAAFRSTAMILVLVGIISLFMISISMRLTYSPLARLARKLNPDDKQYSDLIFQLDKAFFDINSENQVLQDKIDSYHLQIQNSLINAGISTGDSAIDNRIEYMDHLYHSDGANCFIIVRFSFSQKRPSNKMLSQLMATALTERDRSVILESNSERHVFIVNISDPQTDYQHRIESLGNALYQEYGARCAISNSSPILIDIPSLYENALAASKAFPDEPFVVYSDKPKIQGQSQTHPLVINECLTQLGESLKQYKYAAAQEILTKALAIFDQLLSPGSNYPEFIARCFLISFLMELVSTINERNIKTKQYNELFMDTLYACQSGNWVERKSDILTNFSALVEMLRTNEYELRRNQIAEYLDLQFASPELSIDSLSEHFHLNSVYMSSLFKNEFNENFTDYIWHLRLEKASDMANPIFRNPCAVLLLSESGKVWASAIILLQKGL